MKATMCGIKDCTERVPVKHAQTPLMCGNQSCEKLHSWANKLPDSDLRISVAKLREVLENRIPPYSDPKHVVAEVDLIIEQVKKEI